MNNANMQYGKCRCCLKIGHHRDIMKEYFQNGVREVYIDMFLNCMNIYLLTDSRLTQLICTDCINRLRGADRFRKLVIKTEQQLIKAIDKEMVFVKDTDIEETIKNEIEDPIALDEIPDNLNKGPETNIEKHNNKTNILTKDTKATLEKGNIKNGKVVKLIKKSKSKPNLDAFKATLFKMSSPRPTSQKNGSTCNVDLSRDDINKTVTNVQNLESVSKEAGRKQTIDSNGSDIMLFLEPIYNNSKGTTIEQTHKEKPKVIKSINSIINNTTENLTESIPIKKKTQNYITQINELRKPMILKKKKLDDMEAECAKKQTENLTESIPVKKKPQNCITQINELRKAMILKKKKLDDMEAEYAKKRADINVETYLQCLSTNTKANQEDNSKVRANITLILCHSTIVPFRNRVYYYCLYCEKHYSMYKDLKDHVQCSHADESQLMITRKLRSIQDVLVKADISDIQCKICGANLKTVEIFVEHLVKVHNKVYNNDTILKPSHGILAFDMTNDSQCHLCSKTFLHFKKLALHMSEHYGRFICEFCGKRYLAKYRLDIHLASSHVPGKCMIEKCGVLDETNAKSFHVQKDYPAGKSSQTVCPDDQKKHNMVSVDGIKRRIYTCKTCGKRFSNANTLSLHKRLTHKTP